uniref:Uncharacterized protein n=1 Tax=Trypanosoma vivax (strain Y486) TaxID=1055687 RepID=G0U3W9_TRYVY|nr:hypothetical protein, unlikely [Trypanosoma vivax Y486]
MEHVVLFTSAVKSMRMCRFLVKKRHILAFLGGGRRLLSSQLGTLNYCYLSLSNHQLPCFFTSLTPQQAPHTKLVTSHFAPTPKHRQASYPSLFWISLTGAVTVRPIPSPLSFVTRNAAQKK